jgi:hypothetical protein
MATGSLDANGIWIYGEDDSEPTFSGLLNKLGDSTSDAIALVKNDSKGTRPATSGGVNGLTYHRVTTPSISVAAGATTDIHNISFTGIAGRLYKATHICYVDSSVTNSRFTILFTNGSNTILRDSPSQTQGAWIRIGLTSSYMFTATGATTLKIRLNAVDSTTTVYGGGAGGVYQSTFVIEDIGAA